MSSKHPRVFGTTEEAIAKAESALGRRFPPSFRAWLLQNNGHSIEGVTIFPVISWETTIWSSTPSFQSDGKASTLLCIVMIDPTSCFSWARQEIEDRVGEAANL
jgi:hypothetical protein